ncbi:restriction endonuclease subunit S [Staphylococcus equorum]|uniref:restriction endonuclease subunit S n=1 Tax=Staphylococcus equorum TaxID=246432 RepID=UPI0021C07DF5|nr:restriction endonuclease subunit S [Staphylococcus equorum]
MTNDVKNIPELRFPEFSSEWIEKRLGDIGEFKNGLNKDKTEFGFGVPFVNLNDVFSNIPIVKENLSLVNANDKEIKDYNLVQGDTLFIRSSVKPSGVGLTKVIINNDFINTVYSGFLIRYRNFEKYNIDNNFKKYIFNSKSVRKQVIRQSTSSANTNINQEELKLIKINMPPTVEQQKIGEFFSKLDRQIELEEQKLEKLEEQKKGYMQKIFSQELRFKDENGNDYPEWKEEKLNNVLEKIIDNRGKTPENNATEIYPILEVNSLGNYYPKYKKVVKFVSEETYKTWFREHLKVNDVLFSTVGNTGIVSLMDNNKAVIAQNIVGLRLNYENEAAFLYYLLSYWENQKKVKQIQMGAVQPSVKVSQFKYLKFFFPVKDEQRKISVFLTKFDKVFENQSNKIEILKERKKGFLQKMFV